MGDIGIRLLVGKWLRDSATGDGRGDIGFRTSEVTEERRGRI